MRAAFIFLAVALLAGCAAPPMSEMRQSAPARTYVSTKSQDALSKCILFSWQDTNLAGATAVAFIQPGRTGGLTVYTQGNEYFADLHEASGKTKVSYYQFGDTWISKKLIASMSSCM